VVVRRVRREAVNWYDGAKVDMMQAWDALKEGRPTRRWRRPSKPPSY
jgi:hypothetical protein